MIATTAAVDVVTVSAVVIAVAAAATVVVIVVVTGANALRGLSGDDILIGGAGEDRLYGGLGNDVLEGGADADLFVFKEEDFGADIITDFQDGVDAILGLAYSDLTGSQMGSNAVFTLNTDPSQSITFLNTLVTDIDATDFL